MALLSISQRTPPGMENINSRQHRHKSASVHECVSKTFEMWEDVHAMGGPAGLEVRQHCLIPGVEALLTLWPFDSLGTVQRPPTSGSGSCQDVRAAGSELRL